MNGKSPTIPAQTLTDQYTIVRGFRGAQLVLTAYHPHRGFEWSNVFTVKPEAILKTTQAHALHIADRAARSYGAKCAVKAPDGTLVEPSAARGGPVAPPAPSGDKVACALADLGTYLQSGFGNNPTDAIHLVADEHKLSALDRQRLHDAYWSA